mgnify:CR=1 FL=1
MNPDILDYILTKEQKKIGLFLQNDDYNVFLMMKGLKTPVAIFSIFGTPDVIRYEAAQYFNRNQIREGNQ